MLKRTKGYEGGHNLIDFDAFDTVDPLATDLPSEARVLPVGATYESIGLPPRASSANLSVKQLKTDHDRTFAELRAKPQIGPAPGGGRTQAIVEELVDTHPSIHSDADG